MLFVVFCFYYGLKKMLLSELKEALEGIDEVLLVELLNITSKDLVNAFLDVIEDNQDRLKKELND